MQRRQSRRGMQALVSSQEDSCAGIRGRRESAGKTEGPESAGWRVALSLDTHARLGISGRLCGQRIAARPGMGDGVLRRPLAPRRVCAYGGNSRCSAWERVAAETGRVLSSSSDSHSS